MTTTANMGLKKDDPTELYDVGHVNGNSDKIDAYCGENRSRIIALESRVQAAETDISGAASAVGSEANQRITADSALQAQIDALAARVTALEGGGA